ncbi:hypothetical protein B0H10DRAFT_1966981 [Mycena sp. CBHHK59/15]|nr:hypothetical protein B0H10DRAFT_1966981 [Mycena sp. CBHHK59/15]
MLRTDLLCSAQGEDDAMPEFHAENDRVDASPPISGPSEYYEPSPVPEPRLGDLHDPAAAAGLNQATAAAREGVWSNGHRVMVEDDEDQDAMFMDADLEGFDGGEDDFWGDGDEDYDEFEWLYGLPAGDIIDEDMERELAQFGASCASRNFM